MPGRAYSANNEYRYGFNGKENDKDIGEGGQDYGMRIYDTRLGRFLSTDPISADYPELTPYQFGHNNPIMLIDLDGMEGVEPPKPGKPGTKEGEQQETTGGSGCASDNPGCDSDDPSTFKKETWYWYSGNLNRASGPDWYKKDEYKFITQDWEHGQVMQPGEGDQPYTTGMFGGGGREWNGYEVNDNGYLTGRNYRPLYLEAGVNPKNLLKGLGSLVRLRQIAPGLFKKGAYTVYSGFKDGILYIGKTGYTIAKRYAGKTPPAGIEALKGLSGQIPNNGIAKGVEQLVMNLNGWAGGAGKTVILANKNAATVNEIYMTVARRWLNQNVKDWEILFKFQ